MGLDQDASSTFAFMARSRHGSHNRDITVARRRTLPATSEPRMREDVMTGIVVPSLIRGTSLAFAALLSLSLWPADRADALSLASPAMAPAAKASADITTEVRGGHGGHGGGHGGFHGGGFRAGPAMHGGGIRHFGGHGFARHGFARPGFVRPGFARPRVYAPAYAHHHRHHFHRRFIAYRYAPVHYYGYPHRYCRVVWTYYGPRKICRYRPWHHHWRRHHRHWRAYW